MGFRKGFYKGWLTNKALIELRQDICLDSLYISDYRNRFGIDPEQVCAFFDGFSSFIEEKMNEDGHDGGNEYLELRARYDTSENLLEWYGCFADSPFTKFVD